MFGLDLDPPKKSLGPLCREKTPGLALEHTQPSLRLRQGQGRTERYHSIRGSTVTLGTPLSYLGGKLIDRTKRKPPPVEWLGFLKQRGRETPSPRDPPDREE